MSTEHPKYLKSLKNQRTFDWTPALAKLPTMVPCDVHGNVAQGHIGNAGEETGKKRRKTPFLGNPRNGVLYEYSPFLAELEHMISIDSREQWDEWKLRGTIPETPADTLVPTLGRTAAKTGEGGITATKAASEPAKLSVDENPAEDTGVKLPDIAGLGPREAKTVLSDWAESNFGTKLDRRPGLEEVIEACNILIAEHGRKAAAQA